MSAVMDALVQVASSPWFYVVILLMVAVDSVVPVVPGEPVVITAGLLAASGPVELPLVVGSAALGAFLGDQVAYRVGTGGGPLTRHLRGRRWGASLLTRAESLLLRRGGLLLVGARFLPGGRTATNLAAGALRYPLLRFRAFVAVAAVAWGCYTALLGYWGGTAFSDDPAHGLLVGLGVGCGVTVVLDVVRRLRARQ